MCVGVRRAGYVPPAHAHLHTPYAHTSTHTSGNTHRQAPPACHPVPTSDRPTPGQDLQDIYQHGQGSTARPESPANPTILGSAHNRDAVQAACIHCMVHRATPHALPVVLD